MSSLKAALVRACLCLLAVAVSPSAAVFWWPGQEVDPGAKKVLAGKAVILMGLEGNNYIRYCSGTEIGPGVVVTAAHCLAQKDRYEEIAVGSLDDNSQYTQHFIVSQFKFNKRHYEFDYCDHDLTVRENFNALTRDYGLAMKAGAQVTNAMLQKLGTDNSYQPSTRAIFRGYGYYTRTDSSRRTCKIRSHVHFFREFQFELPMTGYAKFPTEKGGGATNGLVAMFDACGGESGSGVHGKDGKLIGVLSYTIHNTDNWWKGAKLDRAFGRSPPTNRSSIFAGWRDASGFRGAIKRVAKAPSAWIARPTCPERSGKKSAIARASDARPHKWPRVPKHKATRKFKLPKRKNQQL